MTVGRNVILEKDRILFKHFYEGTDGKGTELTFIKRNIFFLVENYEKCFSEHNIHSVEEVISGDYVVCSKLKKCAEEMFKLG